MDILFTFPIMNILLLINPSTLHLLFSKTETQFIQIKLSA